MTPEAQAERDAIVAWLRAKADKLDATLLRMWNDNRRGGLTHADKAEFKQRASHMRLHAKAIEQGDHLQPPPE